MSDALAEWLDEQKQQEQVEDEEQLQQRLRSLNRFLLELRQKEEEVASEIAHVRLQLRSIGKALQQREAEKSKSQTAKGGAEDRIRPKKIW